MSKKSYISLIFSNLVMFKTLSSNHRMNNLYAKFVKILEICKQFSENLVNESGNVPRRGPVPKFSDLEVVALSLTAETESIDSEKWLFDYKLQEYKNSIPNHSTNLRLTVQIHSTFSRVVQITFFLYENFFLKNNVTIVTTQDSYLIVSYLWVTLRAFSNVT